MPTPVDTPSWTQFKAVTKDDVLATEAADRAFHTSLPDRVLTHHTAGSLVGPGGLFTHVEQDEGPLLLLLHGCWVFWYAWRHLIPVLAQHCHVVAPDLRGFNDSDKSEGVEQYQLPHLVEDVRGLLHFFGHEQAILVGHDVGAFVAWAFAASYPEATARLISCANFHPGVLQKVADQGYTAHGAALR